jgi:predicted TIM-barrel fold metal-dependent hydrolase
MTSLPTSTARSLDKRRLKRFTETVHEPLHIRALKIDIHQHLWPAALVTALRRRERPPCLRDWTLELAGEPDYEVDPERHDAGLRAAEARADGLDLALVSLSSPLGIESLPPREAYDLLDAYHDGALALPPPFRGWAAACLTEVDPRAVERELDRGLVGLQLPATSLSDADGYARLRPLLDVLEDGGRPLFVHPGPATPGSRHMPAWWAAMVTYVQQMHAAWFAFRVYGRPRHPRLRVCFAMLAGLAPLHGERFAARAGRRSVVDENVFLEISSYGTRAVDATVRVLGTDVIVNGSDRPYAEPVTPDLGSAALFALRSTNALRLLDLKEVPNAVAVAAGA